MMSFQFMVLVDRVAYECDVTRDEILSPKLRGPRHVSAARAIAVYCTRRMWGTSYPRLGQLFNRTSAGVQYLEQNTEYLMDYDRRTQRIVRKVMEMEATT